MTRNVGQVFIVTTTSWNRDTGELFDYGATGNMLSHYRFKANNHSKLFRNNLHGENYFGTDNCALNPFYAFVCQLDVEQTPAGLEVWLRLNKQKNQRVSKIPPYLVLNKIKWNGTSRYQEHPLKIGDCIKFGKFQYEVLQLKTEKEIQSCLRADEESEEEKWISQEEEQENDGSQKESEGVLAANSSDQEKDNEITGCLRKRKFIKKIKNNRSKAAPNQSVNPYTSNFIHFDKTNKTSPTKAKPPKDQNCRICFSNDQTPQDPLISPCLCKGSCFLIHLSCLKNWVSTKVETHTQNGTTTYLLQKPSCQICKHPYPKVLKVAGKNTLVFNITTPKQGAYIILEGSVPGSNSRKYVVIEGNPNKTTRIGRNQDCEFRIPDQNISRRHAEISFKQDGFYLKDVGSKFGTLLKLQSDTKFQQMPISIQVGRCHYMFQLTPQLVEWSNSSVQLQ